MKLKTLFMAVALGAFALVSCKKEEQQSTGVPEITVNGGAAATLNFTKSAQSQTVTIVSNRQWSMEALSEDAKKWITVSGAEGTQEVTSGKTVTIAVAENTAAARQYEITFTNGTKSVLVAVNQTSGIAPKTLPYSEDFTSSLGEDFSIMNLLLPSQFTYIWSFDSKNSCAKASCGTSSASYEGEAWLVSPVLDLTGAIEPQISFSFAQNYGTASEYAKNFYGKILCDGQEEDVAFANPSSGSWTYTIQKVDVSKYAGKTIQFAFVYKSSTSSAPTVDLRYFKAASKQAPFTTNKIADVLAAQEGTEITLTDVIVAAVGKEGCLLTDKTDFIYCFKEAEGYSVARLDVVTVKGQTVVYSEKKQFASADVQKTGTGTLDSPIYEDITANFDTFKSDRIKAVKFQGTLQKSTSGVKTFYNVIVAGATNNKGSLVPVKAIDLDSYDGKVVNIEGFYLYTTGVVYINVLPINITPADYINVDPASKTVASTDTSVSFDVKSNVTWSISLPAGFTCDESLSGVTGDKTVTIKFAPNTTEQPIVTSFEVKDVAGKVASKTFTLNQKKAGATSTEIVVDFSNKDNYPTDFPAVKGTTAEKTYRFAGYDFKFYGPDSYYYLSSGKALLFGKQNAYVELPVIEGKTLTTVKFVTSSGASVKVATKICSTSGEEVSPAQTLSEKEKEYTFDLIGPKVSTAYRIVVANANNCQITKLTLIYE